MTLWNKQQRHITDVRLHAAVLPGGHGHLRQACDEDGGGQPHEGDDGLLQEVHLAHQYVRSFGARRYLFHEIHVYLKEWQKGGIKHGYRRRGSTDEWGSRTWSISVEQRQMKKKGKSMCEMAASCWG